MQANVSLFEKLAAASLVPVVVLDDAGLSNSLADALIDGGLPIAEVTFRTPAAAAAIATMASRADILVGAGTVLDVDTVKRAVDAGATFIVSPGFCSKVVSYCFEQNIPIVPGTVTPSEVMQAISNGLSVVKFFPAESFGGIKMIKALAAPFPGLKFIPTGGISEMQLEEYLSIPQVLAVGGSWFVTRDLIAARRFGEITRLTKQARAAAKKARP